MTQKGGLEAGELLRGRGPGSGEGGGFQDWGLSLEAGVRVGDKKRGQRQPWCTATAHWKCPVPSFKNTFSAPD